MISQDSIREGLAYGAEHPDGMAPEGSVHSLRASALSILAGRNRGSGDQFEDVGLVRSNMERCTHD
jgi:hypothetical protein